MEIVREVLLFMCGVLLAADVTRSLFALARGVPEQGWLARLVASLWPWGVIIVAVVSVGVWQHALACAAALAAGIALGWGWARPEASTGQTDSR
jgi:hypothetical protein